jgi:type IV pilus assembly protein PilX
MGIHRVPQHPGRNTGVALFISLVLLLVLTILGVSVVQTTSLEIRMARNEHDTLLAFEAAESALRDAEAVIEATTSTVLYNDAGNGGLWNLPELTDGNRWENTAIWSDGRSIMAPTPVDAVAGQVQPRYMIEHIASVQRDENAYQQDNKYNNAGTADSVEVFRVTALGFGGSPNSRVMLQTTYGRVLD